ncbi:hypothetical protein [Lysinibacter sp. HNR]|uniref:hypothetical protein n=1 Tax=Lysinibacter sp. HNR TaxID=3031408 RepID=UPI0024349448|nr:hypothetical protein [Lysinibacter sp. HNR]WGD36832.1 hypothetical protein FrondiHNR_10275 [Lysinibacter sp. HNR]
MVIRNSFPTGLPTGLPVLDTRQALAGLIARDTQGRVRAGVLPVHLNALVTGRSTMAYSVADMTLVTSRVAGGSELWRVDGTEVVTTTAAPTANARLDVIYARARFSSSADTSNAPELGVAQGTVAPINSLVKPAIPPGAVELAMAQVSAGATSTQGTGVVITQSAPYTSTAGGVVIVRTAMELAAWSPPEGSLAYCIADTSTYRRASGVWNPVFHEREITITPHAYYNLHEGVYRASAYTDGPRVYLEGLVRNSIVLTVNAGARYALATIPAADAPARTLRFGTSSRETAFAMIEVTTTGEISYWLETGFTTASVGVFHISLSGISWRRKR